jgi:hypothetical protein
VPVTTLPEPVPASSAPAQKPAAATVPPRPRSLSELLFGVEPEPRLPAGWRWDWSTVPAVKREAEEDWGR